MSDASSAAPARFMLSFDQLHVLEAQAALPIPLEFHTEWGEEVTDEEGDRREADAIGGLAAMGFLVPAKHASSIADRVNPAVRAYLGLFADPSLHVSVRSWGGGRTYVHSVAVLSGYATALIRTQRLDDHGQNPRNEDLVEFSAFAFPALIGELLRSLREIDSARPALAESHGSIVLPLTELGGLITAIRSDRPETIDGAFDRVAINAGSVPIARAASFGIDAGFTLSARSLATGDQFSSHWFRSDSGWFELALSIPPFDSVNSSVELTDRSRVRLSTHGSESTVAAVILAIGTLAGVIRG